MYISYYKYYSRREYYPHYLRVYLTEITYCKNVMVISFPGGEYK